MRKTCFKAIAALAVMGIAAPAAARTPQDGDLVTIHVHTVGFDLTDAADLALLKQHVRQQAEHACVIPRTNASPFADPSGIIDMDCREQLIEKAGEQIARMREAAIQRQQSDAIALR